MYVHPNKKRSECLGAMTFFTKGKSGNSVWNINMHSLVAKLQSAARLDS